MSGTGRTGTRQFHVSVQRRMKTAGTWLSVLSALMLFFSTATAALASPSAQELAHWSEPMRIPEYHNPLSPPKLAAGRDGTVHAFELGGRGGVEFAIYHREWTLDAGWSRPVDILLPPFLGVAPSLQDVLLTSDDELLLIFYAGGQEGGDLYLSSANVASANTSVAWSQPVALNAEASTVATGRLFQTQDGRIHLVYGGQRFGVGLYEMVSTDDGTNWSQSRLIWRSSSQEVWPDSIWFAEDDAAHLHIVWDTVSSLGQVPEIRYARQDLSTGEWSHSSTLAARETEQELLASPTIIFHDGKLLTVYQDGFPPTRWMRISSDYGDSWRPPARLFPHVGGYGDAVMLEDSLDRLHMVLGNRFPSPETYGMWYSRMIDNQWSPLTPIVSGPGTDSFGPCCPSAVVVEGNILLATWAHNVSQEFLTGAWFSYAVLPDAPRVVGSPYPTATPLATEAVAATQPGEPGITATPTAVPGGVPADNPTSLPGGENPAIAVLVGLLPVLLLVGVFLVSARQRAKSATEEGEAANRTFEKVKSPDQTDGSRS